MSVYWVDTWNRAVFGPFPIPSPLSPFIPLPPLIPLPHSSSKLLIACFRCQEILSECEKSHGSAGKDRPVAMATVTALMSVEVKLQGNLTEQNAKFIKVRMIALGLVVSFKQSPDSTQRTPDTTGIRERLTVYETGYSQKVNYWKASWELNWEPGFQWSISVSTFPLHFYLKMGSVSYWNGRIACSICALFPIKFTHSSGPKIGGLNLLILH